VNERITAALFGLESKKIRSEIGAGGMGEVFLAREIIKTPTQAP